MCLDLQKWKEAGRVTGHMANLWLDETQQNADSSPNTRREVNSPMILSMYTRQEKTNYSVTRAKWWQFPQEEVIEEKGSVCSTKNFY